MTSNQTMILKELHRRYDVQRSEVRLLMSTCHVLLLISALMTIAISIAMDTGTLMYLALGLSTLGFIICLIAALPKTAYFPIDISEVELEDYLQMDKDELMLQLIVQYSHFIQVNITPVSNRSTSLQVAMVCLAGSAVASIWSIIL